jgi:hypothetical protein
MHPSYKHFGSAAVTRKMLVEIQLKDQLVVIGRSILFTQLSAARMYDCVRATTRRAYQTPLTWHTIKTLTVQVTSCMSYNCTKSLLCTIYPSSTSALKYRGGCGSRPLDEFNSLLVLRGFQWLTVSTLDRSFLVLMFNRPLYSLIKSQNTQTSVVTALMWFSLD